MLITLSEARKRIGVSRETMRVWVKEGRFTIYSNPRDGRQKLVEYRDLEEHVPRRYL